MNEIIAEVKGWMQYDARWDGKRWVTVGRGRFITEDGWKEHPEIWCHTCGERVPDAPHGHSAEQREGYPAGGM